MKDKLDRETGDAVTKEQRIASFVGSQEWKWIREEFVKKVVELNDLMALDVDIEKLAQEIQARKYATEILMNWIGEIEGTKATSEQNAEVLRETHEVEIIKVFPEN